MIEEGRRVTNENKIKRKRHKKKEEIRVHEQKMSLDVMARRFSTGTPFSLLNLTLKMPKFVKSTIDHIIIHCKDI